MKQHLISTFLLLSCVFLSCDNKNKNIKKNSFKATYKETAKLVPINLEDKKYIDVKVYCKDTLTKSGWKIEYLVKDDKTKYEDLYIKWSKGNQTAVFCSAATLLMRSFFIPVYKGENQNHIFLTHGCSTSSEAILTLPKNTKQKGIDYCYVIDYDIKAGKIGYIPERSYSLDELEIEIVNLENGITKPLVFKNKCLVAPEESCIDMMKFDKNSVEITATLIDKNDNERRKTIIEKHTLQF